ncbi:MAG: hypothetical protein MPW16_17135 [Candidatus Manganitrophus sp.]|nr:MAG: hypothetical protein MPW16_17135 [Candidatus Manganitrophus sp.]
MDIGFVASFSAGLISFLAPCVLPIVPSYLAYITGIEQADTVQEGEKRSWKRFVPLLIFIAGFSAVFVLLGATASSVGLLLSEYQKAVAKIGGIVVIFFGFHFTNLMMKSHFRTLFGGAGLISAVLFFSGSIQGETAKTLLVTWAVLFTLYLLGVHRFLYRQLRVEKNQKTTRLGALLMGVAFGAGWTPCIGPVLGSILILASEQQTVLQGMMLLLAYSIGLGLPFILAGIFWIRFLSFVQKFSRFFLVVEGVGGVLLIGMGLLLVTGNLELLSGIGS